MSMRKIVWLAIVGIVLSTVALASPKVGLETSSYTVTKSGDKNFTFMSNKLD
jgi:hypothetical protein